MSFTYETKLLIRSGAFIERYPRSQYFFIPVTEGTYLTESYEGGEFVPETGISLSGQAQNFPKTFNVVGGVKLSGSGSLGTVFYSTPSILFFKTKRFIGSNALIETSSQDKYYFNPSSGTGFSLLEKTVGYYEYECLGGIRLSGKAPLFPVNIFSSGGLVTSGTSGEGTNFYTPNVYSIKPYTHVVIPLSGIYGQTFLKDTPGYVLPLTGIFAGEDIEGPSGIYIGGVAVCYKKQTMEYLASGQIITGETSEPNSATNKPVQLPILDGGLLFGPISDALTEWVRKFAHTSNTGIQISGPNNISDGILGGSFKSTSSLSRIVPGIESYSGDNGVVFWAWDEVLGKPLGNYFVHFTNDKTFGLYPGYFTWSVRFKADSRLSSLSEEVLLACMVSSRDYIDDRTNNYLYISILPAVSGIILIRVQGYLYTKTLHWPTPLFSWESYYFGGSPLSYNTEYRIVVNMDSGDSNPSDRIKVNLNGTRLVPSNFTSNFSQYDGFYESSGINGVDDYYYHGIGSGYGVDTQFFGIIYESIFLDGLLKTDSDLYSSTYTGPYNTPYSYHLKYENPSDLGYNSANRLKNFVSDYSPPYSEVSVPCDSEPVFSSRTVTLQSYLNDKIFTFYSKLYIPKCINNHAVFDEWNNSQNEIANIQGLRAEITSNFEITRRVTIGIRFFIDPRYEGFSTVTEMPLLAVTAFKGSYVAGGLYIGFLSENADPYTGEESHRGASLRISNSPTFYQDMVSNCDIQLFPDLIPVNTHHRLVIQIDTTNTLDYERVKVFLNDKRIDRIDTDNNVVSRAIPVQGGGYVQDWGYPYQDEYIILGEEPNEYDSIYVTVGSTYVNSVLESFLGKISEVVFLNGLNKNPENVLPLSGKYSYEYGLEGSFHYKFESPNVYENNVINSGNDLVNIGSSNVSIQSINELANASIFAIQNHDGHYRDVTQYYKLGFKNSVLGYFPKYEASGSVSASLISTTSLIEDSWNEIQLNVDTTSINGADRIKLYVNKNLVSLESSPVYIPKDTEFYSGSDIYYNPYTVIGNLLHDKVYTENQGFVGYISKTIYADGFILPTSYFDSLENRLYGGAGFKLEYNDPTNLGYDSSPYKNHFTNIDVTYDLVYDSNYDFGKMIGFTFNKNTIPIQDINLLFKLISTESVTLSLAFTLNLDPSLIVLPFKLIGSGVQVQLDLPFNLVWTSNFNSGIHTNTQSVVSTFNTPILVTYENISGTVITDTTNTIFYQFGTSASDPNSLNGWINQVTGAIVIFDLTTQLNNGVLNPIYSGATLNVNYNYNLVQSLLIWSMSCSIGQLIGEISVEYEEDASTVAKFTLLPGPGDIDPLVYIGKSVVLSVTFSNSIGTIYPNSGGVIFTGIVSEVEWDADIRVLNVTADTQMPAFFNGLSRQQIDSVVGGIWSPQVWDNEDDSTGWTYAQERLSTTENTIWHDRNGALRINSFKAGNSSITFTDDERFHETLKLEFAQRSEMVNQIRIDLSYSYPRRREAKTQIKWTDPSNGLIQTFLCGGNSYQLCQRSMVEGAATGGSWVPISQITYDPIWPAQAVFCGPGIYDFIVWGVQLNEVYTPRRTDTGEWEQVVMVDLDTGKLNAKTGKMDYETKPGEPGVALSSESLTPPEVTNALCIGAHWTAARRWIQNVSEEYEIIVQCQDSIDTIGVVASTESYSIDSGIEDNEWENSLTPYKYTVPTGSLAIPGSKDPYWNLDDTNVVPITDENVVTREDFDLAQEVIMSAAKIDILKSHRLTTVSFQVPYQSGVDLSQTVTVNTPYLSATGKLRIIKHQFSIDTGEASTELFIAISRHNGNGLYQDDPLDPLDRPTPSSENPIDPYIKLKNYVGGRTYGNQGFTGKWYDGRADGEEDPNNPGQYLPGKEPWEGFMTNYESPLNSYEWSGYMSLPSNLVPEAAFKARLDVAAYTIPYQFILRGPEIDETHTSASEVQASQIYNVNIPVDYLRISA